MWSVPYIRRRPAGVGELVEGALGEPDRERLDRPAGGAGGQGAERARVDAARQEHADRDVGHEVGAHRVVEPPQQLARPLVDVPRGRVGGGRAAAGTSAAPRPGRPRRPAGGRARACARPEDGARRRDAVARQVEPQRVEVQLARHRRVLQQALELGAERQRAAVAAPVQRLDGEAVVGQHQAPAPGVPQGDREHAAQVREALEADVLVQVQDGLEIALGGERVTVARQALAQPAVVVDLAIANQHERAVLVSQRLLGVGDVDDRQTAHGERHGAVGQEAVAVGAAVHDAVRHPPAQVDVGRRAVEAQHPADAAHYALGPVDGPRRRPNAASPRAVWAATRSAVTPQQRAYRPSERSATYSRSWASFHSHGVTLSWRIWAKPVTPGRTAKRCHTPGVRCDSSP